MGLQLDNPPQELPERLGVGANSLDQELFDGARHRENPLREIANRVRWMANGVANGHDDPTCFANGLDDPAVNPRRGAIRCGRFDARRILVQVNDRIVWLR
jgi:hypothetical protein